MASLSVEELIEREKAAWEVKDRWDDLSRDAYALAFPSRNRYQDSHTVGDNKDDEIFDGTLLSSNINLANKLQADIYTGQFMKLVPGITFNAQVPPEIREQVEAQLETINAIHQAAMQVSNFDQVINEMLLDYGVGTGIMMVVEGDNTTPLQYVAVNPAQMALGEGANGAVWEYYRRHPILPRNVRPTWDSSGFDPPEWWDEWADKSENNKAKITIKEITYFSYADKAWYFTIIAQDQDNEGSQGHVKLVDKKMKSSLWLSPRWNKEAGEVWGRGPVIYALPDAKVLNKVKELILKSASIKLFPPMTYVDDMDFNAALFDMTPFAMNPVSRNGGPLGRAVEPLDIGGDLGMTQLVLGELSANIKRLMLDDQLPPQTGAVRSPTEIDARQLQIQQNKAAPFGRLSKEHIRPMAQMNLDILAKKGLIDKIEIDGLFIDLQIINPQAQAEQEAEVFKLERVLAITQQVDPDLPKLTMKVEEMPAWITRNLGLTPELNRSIAEIDEAQQLVGQMQQQELANANQN